MARPRKEGMDYFSHDTDAVNDEKIDALRSVFGNDGYAFYFILLERIYRTDHAGLDVSKPIMLASLANKIGVTVERFKEMLEASFDVDLFNKNDFEKHQIITSNGIKKRFSEINSMRERWRNVKGKQKENEIVFSLENPMENNEENEVKTPQSKVKESKVNKTKNKYAERVLLTKEEYQKLFDKFGEVGVEERIQNLSLYKLSTGKTYISDYHTILNWERKNKKDMPNRPNPEQSSYKTFDLEEVFN